VMLNACDLDRLALRKRKHGPGVSLGPWSHITVVGCDLSSAKTKLDTPAGRSRKLLHALDRMFALPAPPSEKATAREDQAGQASADGGAGNRTRLGQT
jgi:hypothetical protein